MAENVSPHIASEERVFVSYRHKGGLSGGQATPILEEKNNETSMT